jgi:uncharacterized membrane protein (UPF0127 family)
MHPNDLHPSRRPAASIALVLLLIAACSQPAQQQVTTEPTPNRTRVERPQAILPDGFSVDLELATTPEETTTGLMFRPLLPEDRGMLLLWKEERFATIWMMNVLVPLDIVFLDDTGQVVELVADAQPCAAEPCPRFTPETASRAVLELAAGAISAHRIAVGERIGFTKVAGYPVESEDIGIRN